MIKQEVTIINKLGLHARAAAKLVNLAGSFGSHIELQKDGSNANAKSIMGVMMLAASQNSQLTLVIEGDDESAALQAIVELINDKFGEDE